MTRALITCVGVCVCAVLSAGSTADDLRALADGEDLRIAWLREVNGTSKFLGWGQYSLRAYDTRDGVDRGVAGWLREPGSGNGRVGPFRWRHVDTCKPGGQCRAAYRYVRL